MKKNLGALLGLLLLSASPAAQAQFGYMTNVNNTNTVTITNYSGHGGAVTIPTTINGLTVTAIGTDAFYDIPSVASVLMPNTVSNIGDYAFAYCVGMTNVTIPASVTNIGVFSFGFCSALTNVGLASNIRSIGNLAFAYTGISSVTIPASLTNIGVGAFADCASLTAINVNQTNPAYGSALGVLYSSDMTDLVQYPGGLGGAVTIAGAVTSIGADAFEGCAKLASVNISDSVTNIGDDAFSECTSLTNVTIPASVSRISDYVFYGCIELANITIPNSITSIGVQAFTETGLTNVTIPSSVTNIATEAFDVCPFLASITIAGSVTNLGDYVFYNCFSLNSVYFTGNPPAVGASVFESDTPTLYYLPDTTNWNAFSTAVECPAVLWNPIILAAGDNFGIDGNNFGFTITNAANLTVVVEACSNLVNPVWTPLQTVTLTNGSFYFSEPLQTNCANRYYGLGLP